MTETGKTYEMFWDCGFCGSTELLGKTHRHCPSCGAAQDPAARYFPPEDRKVAVEDHVYVGADLVCANCSAPSSARAAHCGNCGAAIGDDDSRVSLAHERARPEPKPEPRRSRRGLWAGLAVAGTVAIAVLVTVFWTRTSTLKVTGHSWQRAIEVEVLEAVRDGAWCDARPARAYNVKRSRKQRGTEKIPDGETCTTKNVDRGDGTYKQVQRCTTKYREKPVYDQWCDFTIDRWVHQRTVTADGGARSPAPAWPAVTTRDCARLGCERIGSKTETYTVHMLEQGSEPEARACGLDRQRWSTIEVDSQWQAEVRVVTGGVDCDTLQQEGGP